MKLTVDGRFLASLVPLVSRAIVTFRAIMILPASLAAGIFVLVSLMLSACSESESVLKNENVAAWSLNSLNTGSDSLENYRGKTLVINFWATWCGPCRQEMPDLQALSESLDAEKYAVIGVTVDQDLNLAKEFLLTHSIRFPQFSDTGMEIAGGLLGIKAYPETLVVSPQGIVVDRIVGVQPWSDSKYIQSVLGVAVVE